MLQGIMSGFQQNKQIILNNKVIWLTGGSSGIGLALLHRLLALGATVIVTCRNVAALDDLKFKYPDRLLLLQSDFNSEQDLAELKVNLDDMMQQHDLNAIDIMILNAGVCEYVDAEQLDLSLFQRMVQVNFYAAITCTKVALPYLYASQNKPLLMGVSSLATQLPFTQAQAYGASKAAFSYFLESMRVDLQQKIDVTVVTPGFVKTPLTDKNHFQMPFLISSEKAAERILIAMVKRPFTYRFPKRFAYLLNLMSYFPRLWLGISKRMNEESNTTLP